MVFLTVLQYILVCHMNISSNIWIVIHLFDVCICIHYNELHWFVFVVNLRNRQLFHTTYKMYMVSLGTEVLYLICMCIAYGKYANDGIENKDLKTFGKCYIFLMRNDVV